MMDKSETEIRKLSEIYETLSLGTAARLVRTFDGVDGIESADRADIEEIRGVNKEVINEIGIWNEDKESDKTINLEHCPVCGEEYLDKSYYEYRHERNLKDKSICVKMIPPKQRLGDSDSNGLYIYYH